MSSPSWKPSLFFAAFALFGCAADAGVDSQESAPSNLAIKQHGREYGNCSPEQITELRARMAEASPIADDAQIHWNDPSYAGYVSAYQTWFGWRGNDEVGRVINKVASDLHHTKSFQYWCNPPKNLSDPLYNPACGDNEWAAKFVYFGSTPTVILCNVYWSQPEDNRTLDILHELTHSAGTDDITYDIDEALRLAATDPDSAAANAFNYEQFYRQVTF